MVRDGYISIYLIVTFGIVLFMVPASELGYNILSYDFWFSQTDPSSVIRNIFLVALGIPAAIIAYWRSSIALKQTALQEKGLNIDRFHSGLSLLAEDENFRKVAGVSTLDALYEIDESLRSSIHLCLIEFIRDRSRSLFRDDHTHVTDNDSYSEFCNRDPCPSDVRDAFYVVTKHKEISFLLRDESEIVRFRSCYLRGVTFTDDEGTSFADCDLTDSHLVCRANTMFTNCDLTRARVHFAEPNKVTILNCNVSDLRIEVANDKEVAIAGWHFEDHPPQLADYWGMPVTPAAIRIIRFEESRISTFTDLEDYFLRRDLSASPIGLGRDLFRKEPPNQSIVPYVDSPEWKKIWTGLFEPIGRM